MTENLLTINDYSRPGRKMRIILGVVLHWTANPGVSAESNRDFFESRKTGTLGAGSAHYIIGLNGETIRCIPEDEMAYHCGSSQADPVSKLIYTDLARELFGEFAKNPKALSPNQVTIGIELCPIDSRGNFNPSTIDSAVDLVSDIAKRYSLSRERIVTHNQVVGWKDCPRLWVNHPEYFEAFKDKVFEARPA